MKRLDLFLIVAALLIAFVTIAAVIVRAGGHDPQLTSPAAVSGPASTTLSGTPVASKSAP